MPELKYDPREMDKKWQERWERDGLYKVRSDDPRPKWYSLTMFPYTSGDLHIGHWYAMVPSDAHSRFRRMQGYNVLHPMGFDAFGLPAENAAIKRGIHPFKWTMGNVENMRRQLRSIGAVYDWDREVVTCLPEYYKWNQWLFLKLYKAGLAYRAKAPAVWCPSCQTVLANEQVVDGKCERCGTTVTRRDLEQWFLRITRYADELLDHSRIQWPERVVTMQKNWIGRSEGVEISFAIEHYGLPEKAIRVFTTRADTIYGVTFMVLAPEHPLVEKLTTPERRAEVRAYVEASRRQSEIERLSTEKEKTGVFTGAYCVNRLNGRAVPIWIADYVLLTYGTGAVMGVPAHDTRDFAFAKMYGLPIIEVVAPPGRSGPSTELAEAYTDYGTMVNSSPFSGLNSQDGSDAIASFLKGKGFGGKAISYRLRDWLISRQRYWGTPIPIIYCQRCGTVPVPEEQLPVVLPEDAEFRPTGESPLAYHQGFVNTTCPECGAKARRETDTMDTFVDSSWYWLRYCSPHYDKGPFDPEAIKGWNPVHQYTGGAEHATMHLLYARFFIKALRDLKLVDFDEPFLRLFNQGTIIAERHKMSKSRGNVITPDPYVEEFGADVIRAYLMFLGPWEYGGEWSDSGINGILRWYNRLWELCLSSPSELPTRDGQGRELQRRLHQTIKRVHHDLDTFQFNTAIAALMELTNFLSKGWQDRSISRKDWQEAVEKLLLLLAPIAPHLAEELWERTGRLLRRAQDKLYSVHNQSFPKWDDALAAEDEITLVVQVDGKLRDRLTVPAAVAEEEAKSLALASPRVQAFLDNKQIASVIYVPGRLVNVVTK